MTAAHEEASSYLVARVPVVAETATVEAALAALAAGPWDSIEAVFVASADGRLAGAVPTAALLGLPRDAPLAPRVDRAYPRVKREADQERVAAEAFAHAATSVAVTDAQGRLVGAVPAAALLEIVRREHVEDLHRLAGIEGESDQSREALEAPPTRRARHRLPWLLVGLAGSFAAAIIVRRFESTLAVHPAVAWFVPAIVYLADAIGTQTEAIAVRGLSLTRSPLRRIAAGELRTGLAIGLVLGAIALPVVAWAFGDPRLGAVVAASIVVAGTAATTIGLLLPWLLHRLGQDPAFGSGPVATIIQDVLSIAIYLLAATLVFGG